MKSTTTGETRQLPAQPSPPTEPPAQRHLATWWVATLIAATVATLWITWPLALHMTQLWSVRLPGSDQLSAPPGDAFSGNDALQTMHVNRVVIDDVLHPREPFLDLVSGAAGPEPLRTTSLDLPWTPVMALIMPFTGLVAAYNSTLLLSSVATALCAFGFLRRHTRFPLVALAGALLYAFVPGRVFQLSLHFNAVMWWAFPAAAWALEVMLERHRDGRRWLVPGGWLAAVTLTVGLSGEYHHVLYLSGMIGFLVAWQLAAAALRRGALPVGPAVLAIGAVAAADAYVVGSFRWVFGGGVAGENGKYPEAVRYAPQGLLTLIHKNPGELGEGLIYLGLPVALLALAAVVVVVARRRAGEAAYAALLVPVLFLTLGPAADRTLGRALRAVGLPDGADPYRRIFGLVPFLHLGTERLPDLPDGAASGAHRQRGGGRAGSLGRPGRAVPRAAGVRADLPVERRLDLSGLADRAADPQRLQPVVDALAGRSGGGAGRAQPGQGGTRGAGGAARDRNPPGGGDQRVPRLLLRHGLARRRRSAGRLRPLPPGRRRPALRAPGGAALSRVPGGQRRGRWALRSPSEGRTASSTVGNHAVNAGSGPMPASSSSGTLAQSSTSSGSGSGISRA